jgi:hypothetical protein
MHMAVDGALEVTQIQKRQEVAPQAAVELVAPQQTTWAGNQSQVKEMLEVMHLYQALL